MAAPLLRDGRSTSARWNVRRRSELEVASKISLEPFSDAQPLSSPDLQSSVTDKMIPHDLDLEDGESARGARAGSWISSAAWTR